VVDQCVTHKLELDAAGRSNVAIALAWVIGQAQQSSCLNKILLVDFYC
jgi:hypothetical protein